MITGLLKNDKLGSNLLFLKQNLANSLILPPKNGGLKAWSHGVRKANWREHRDFFMGSADVWHLRTR